MYRCQHLGYKRLFLSTPANDYQPPKRTRRIPLRIGAGDRRHGDGQRAGIKLFRVRKLLGRKRLHPRHHDARLENIQLEQKPAVVDALHVPRRPR